MHREWGQKLPVGVSQAEQAATAQEDHSGPGVVPCGKMVADRAYCSANSVSVVVAGHWTLPHLPTKVSQVLPLAPVPR